MANQLVRILTSGVKRRPTGAIAPGLGGTGIRVAADVRGGGGWRGAAGSGSDAGPGRRAEQQSGPRHVRAVGGAEDAARLQRQLPAGSGLLVALGLLPGGRGAAPGLPHAQHLDHPSHRDWTALEPQLPHPPGPRSERRAAHGDRCVAASSSLYLLIRSPQDSYPRLPTSSSAGWASLPTRSPWSWGTPPCSASSSPTTPSRARCRRCWAGCAVFSSCSSPPAPSRVPSPPP